MQSFFISELMHEQVVCNLDFFFFIFRSQKQIEMSGKFYFAIDRGGTFTDVVCICPDGSVKTLKLLSVDPERYSDAPREGIRRILAQVSSMKKPNHITCPASFRNRIQRRHPIH